MKEVINIINQIRNTSSSNEKLEILKTNKENKLLKQVLYYTYNPHLKYGITEEVIKPYITGFYYMTVEDTFKHLDLLASSNINDDLRKQTGLILSAFEDDERELFLQILTKDLRCNISEKTISKVWKDLLPQFGCMLASKYFDNEKVVCGKEFTLTIKLDGHRCIIIKEGDSVRAYTRQNKEYLGLEDIINDVKSIDGDFVLDGELLVSNYKDIPPETRYKVTSNIVRKDGVKHGVSLISFDILTLEEFYNGKSKSKYADRRKTLEEKVSHLTHIEVVDKLYSGNDTNVIIPLLDEAVAKGEEGLMLNINSSPYECKRTKGLLKLKKFQTGDVRVIQILEGEGKNKGSLGAITVEFEHDGKLHTCNVGSGFSDNERVTYFSHPELLLNKIVEISYFEVTSNAKGGVGLRFPTWLGRIRNDKDEISMY